MATQCIDDSEYAAILEGHADVATLRRAEQHALDCGDCQGLLAAAGRVRALDREHGPSDHETIPSAAALTAAPDAVDDAPDAPAKIGDAIGRYVLTKELGRGGMGVVYAARDETLQRTVALKLLRALSGSEGTSDRLLREARAMATVEHPNVMTVHDTGVHEGQVFVVMDLIDGYDLRQWLRAKPRPWREIVRVWGQAGSGLQAVHAAGLVHRDFKPANVLVGHGGRVQVTDFGLVGIGATENSSDSQLDLQGLVGDDRTATGTVLGTPRYMSPEQLSGKRVDATSDQFAFCISLWEALVGSHPFGKGDLLARLSAMRKGAIVEPASSVRVPQRVLAIVRRGLAAAPEDRFATVGTLVAALERASRAGRRRTQWAVAVVGLSAALGAGALLGRRDQDRPCATPPEGDFAGVWDPQTRSAAQAGVATHGESPDQWDRFQATLDRYTQAWSDARAEACRATRVRQEVSEEMLDRRMACLQAARSGVATLVEIVSASSYGPHTTALSLAYGLPPLQRCDDLVGLATVAPRPTAEGAAAVVERLEGELAAAATLLDAGQVDEAHRMLDTALDEATIVDWAPLSAKLKSQKALALLDSEPVKALSTWREAFVTAAAAGALVEVEVAMDSTKIFMHESKYEEAAFLLDLVEAKAADLPGIPLPGELATRRMLVAIRQNKREEAERLARTAVSEMEVLVGPERSANAYSNLAGVLAGTGRVAESLPYAQRALDLLTASYGLDHPTTVRTRGNHALSLYAAGHYDEARAEAEAILEAMKRVQLPLQEASALNLLGEIDEIDGNYPAAIERQKRVVEIRARVLPAGHKDIARAQYDLGRTYSMADQPALAREPLEAAIAAVDPEDAGMSTLYIDMHAELASVHKHLGDDAEYIRLAEDAMKLAEKVGDEAGSGGLYIRALAYADQGEYEQAIALLGRTIRAVEHWETAPRFRARLLLDRARLRDESGAPEGSRSDVDRAVAILREVGDTDNEQWTWAQQWLQSHD